MTGKHGPNRLGNYLQVHESCMTGLLREGFVVQDDCRFTILPSVVILEGVIVCLDGISLDVRKEIDVLKGHGPGAQVQTQVFRYHAWVRGSHNIFRYESAHEHRPYAHKHVYDTFGYGQENQLIELRSQDEVPTLTEVLRELHGWHQEHAGRLKELS